MYTYHALVDDVHWLVNKPKIDEPLTQVRTIRNSCSKNHILKKDALTNHSVLVNRDCNRACSSARGTLVEGKRRAELGDPAPSNTPLPLWVLASTWWQDQTAKLGSPFQLAGS